jgi:hypothetical protein
VRSHPSRDETAGWMGHPVRTRISHRPYGTVRTLLILTQDCAALVLG